MTVRIERVDVPEAAVREAIVRPLAEHSTRNNFAFAPVFLTLALKDGEEVDGGLIAQLYWNWMYIEILGVPERLRGRGLGRRLVETAEQEARVAGCRGAWVDTYSFQSPGFYERMGYQPFGALPDYPRGEERLFLAKLFDGTQAGTYPEAA